MKKSIQLLKESIDIWKAAHEKLIAVKGKMGLFNGAFLSINDNEIYCHGYLNCPLCKNYFDNDCNGCPIKEYTGRESCVNTPYCVVNKREYKTREITNNDIKNHLKMIRWMEKLYKELTETNE